MAKVLRCVYARIGVQSNRGAGGKWQVVREPNLNGNEPSGPEAMRAGRA